MARTFRNVGLNNVTHAKVSCHVFHANNQKCAMKKMARYLNINFKHVTDGDVKTLKSIGLIKCNSSKSHKQIKMTNDY